MYGGENRWPAQQGFNLEQPFGQVGALEKCVARLWGSSKAMVADTTAAHCIKHVQGISLGLTAVVD